MKILKFLGIKPMYRSFNLGSGPKIQVMDQITDRFELDDQVIKDRQFVDEFWVYTYWLQQRCSK